MDITRYGIKPKILMLLREDVENPSGGMAVHVNNIVPHLRESFDITIACLSSSQDTEIKEHLGCRLLKIGLELTDQNVSRTSFEEETRELRNLFAVFVKHMVDWEFDLIHVHDAPFWHFVELLKEHYHCPVILTVHLSFRMSHPLPARSSKVFSFLVFMAQKESSAMRHADMIITVSESYKQELENWFLLEDKELRVIPNGVNVSELNEVEEDLVLKHLLSNGRKLVVFVGRIVYTKGIDLILDVVEKFPDHQFVLVSNIAATLEPVVPLAWKLRKCLETHDNLVWMREVSDAWKWKIMKVADIGIMPSTHEPFGIVALEWMALGRPLIVSNVGGLKDFCNENNATIIEPTVTSLENAIRGHVDDHGKFIRAFRTAQLHSWEKASLKIERAYSDLLKLKKGVELIALDDTVARHV